jgi:hypothetical protein
MSYALILALAIVTVATVTFLALGYHLDIATWLLASFCSLSVDFIYRRLGSK